MVLNLMLVHAGAYTTLSCNEINFKLTNPTWFKSSRIKQKKCHSLNKSEKSLPLS